MLIRIKKSDIPIDSLHVRGLLSLIEINRLIINRYHYSLNMPVFFRSFLLVASFFACFQANATFFSSVKKYSIEDGLPATTIYSIVKDKRGYFWLGTPSGLVRFDGYEFNVYSPTSEDNRKIAFASAGNLFIDSKGRIWIGSWGEGAAVYDDNLNLLHWFEADQKNPNALQSAMVQTFFEDRQGQVWVGTNGGGLARFREQSNDFQNYLHQSGNPNSLSHSRIWSISQDSQDIMWIGTSNGLNRLDVQANTVTRYQHNENQPGSLDHPLIRDVFVDQANNIWIGTELSFGLFKQSNQQYIPKIPEHAFLNAAITRIKQGVDDALWIGTQRGLYRFDVDNDRYTALVNERKLALLPNDDIRDIYVGETGELWVTTRYAGLSQITLEPSNFKSYRYFTDTTGNLIQIRMIYDVVEDASKNIWLASSQGLLKWSPDGLQQVAVTDLSADTEVFTLAMGNESQMWLGTENGIGMLDLNTNQFQYRNDIIGDTERVAVIHIEIDSVGNLWAATNHWGLIKYRNGERIQYQHDTANVDSISGDNVAHVMEDNRGRMWITVAGAGINRLDPERHKFFRYQPSEELTRSSAFKNLRQIYQSKSGTMWFAGNNAFLKLNEVTDTFENLIVRSLLPSNNVKSILEDDYGNLWLSTEYGISNYRVEQNYFVNYTTKDGLHGNQFFQRAALNSAEHGLFFGGIEGLTVISKLPKPTPKGSASPVISGLHIDGKRVPDFSFNDQQTMRLPYSVKNIEIKFSALNFSPENNRYRYRLLNFDNMWSKPTADNSVVFSGLDSGQYVFQVNASKSDNIWSTFPAELNIHITKPWWESHWFRGGIALMLLTFGFIGYKSRTRGLKQQKLKLEKEVAERSSDLLKTQKQLIESEKQTSISGLVAGVAHEINTPIGVSITASSNLIERCSSIIASLESNRLKKSELKQNIENIADSAQMLLTNLSRASELVHSFKEVSVDQISQQKRQFNMRGYLAEIVASLNPKFRSAGVTLSTHCPDDIVITSFPGAISQMITQLALNSLSHAFEDEQHGEVMIEISRHNETLKIKFCDNGKGIPKDSLTKIFQPFYTTKRNAGASGLGLQIVSNIIKVRLGGDIYCESEEGKGTCFYMEFAVENK
ncbi:MAG: two-component regulator propeller domain-containing protein [Aestuariibacter sp.]